MKRLILCALLLCSGTLMAQTPWKWKKTCEKEETTLHIDLHEETVNVPSMEMLGPMNGYLGGRGVYGVWMVTSFKIKNDREATLRISNDLGSETQQVRLTLLPDSTCKMELTGGVVVKRAVNRKLVKVPSVFILK